ncbi:sigma-54-dependent transcriptional regulator [Oscillibacter sp.]|jgi:transcriptional regulator with PAS, ATPase and Fis domain|uniref:sigma-54-dependent transcriptional regulator n=1 Tax=Oscillibacter sp. TaxID=1945593 RepID=UPI00216DFB30|nr:sigma-54-dependent transcriptional regulator [Oscillibacter sp.]MCI9649990.1 sigma 54-interacting transcriptional regulator [Oscillibacter sp.]
MELPIRVLGIAPYEGMKALMSNLAEEYPQMDLSLFVGDRELGLEIAKTNFHGNYDVVISRGDTATMLRRDLSIPVVEIEVSMYDLLCTLKLAGSLSGGIAFVAAASVAESARLLCKAMDLTMDIRTYDEHHMVEPILLELRKERFQALLCDTFANNTAKRLGMNSFLVASSVESIRKAFDRALLICGSRQSLREENLFLRSLIRGQISQTVVFDQEGNLFLSTLDAPVPELLEMLRRELPESHKDVERRITRNLGGMLYAIRARQVGAGSAVYTAFFLEARKTPLSPSQSGIRFSSCPEAERAFDDSIFSFAETISDFQTEIAQINQSRAPVLVTGEDGTGKETIVYFLYMRSSLQNHPLISINCSLLNDRSWAFLLEHHNSPLADQDSTLYFSSIDVLSEERQRQLLAVLLEMDVCRRNRVILSCVCQPGEYVSAAGALFLDKLRCLSLYLPPLRSMPQRIPTLVNLSLSHLNASIPRQVVGVEPDGVSLLQSFRWPHNYMQFRRVIKALAVTAAGQVITAESVREVLKKERHMGVFSLRAENAAVPLDLGRTLEEINQDVALRVLEETGGNQTAAAKRLGISRTTLWRLLKK